MKCILSPSMSFKDWTWAENHLGRGHMGLNLVNVVVGGGWFCNFGLQFSPNLGSFSWLNTVMQIPRFVYSWFVSFLTDLLKKILQYASLAIYPYDTNHKYQKTTGVILICDRFWLCKSKVHDIAQNLTKQLAKYVEHSHLFAWNF